MIRWLECWAEVVVLQSRVYKAYFYLELFSLSAHF